MAKIRLLVDTDVYIDYFNIGAYGPILEHSEFSIYYSVVTKKELLGKPGLKTSERKAILSVLKHHRVINIDNRIARRYADLRRHFPRMDREDALIAATALVKRLPLMTRNWKHYRQIDELILFTGGTNP